MMNLSDYIDEADESLRKLAGRVGCSPSYLSELCGTSDGKAKSPSLEMAQKISAATSGKVSISSWPKWAAIERALTANTQVCDISRLEKSGIPDHHEAVT